MSLRTYDELNLSAAGQTVPYQASISLPDDCIFSDLYVMKKLIKDIVTAAISCGLVAACAAPGDGPPRGQDMDYQGSDCISIRTIRDYTPLDRQSLLIEAAAKQHYYVTLALSSFELRSSFQLGFSSRDDWLCPYGGDEIVFDSFSDQRMGIRAISKITKEQAEELLIRHGKKAPPEQIDPAPAVGNGAEVEELG